VSSDDEEYFMPERTAEITPGQRNCAVCFLTAVRICLDSPSKVKMIWGQVDPSLNDFHSDHMQSSGTFWPLDITDWCRQQAEMHPTFTNLSNVAQDIFSIIPHIVGVKASLTLGQDQIGCRLRETTSNMYREKVAVREFPQANNGILSANYTALDTTQTENDLELKHEVADRKLHRMTKIHSFLERWQGSQNLHATQ